METWADGSSRRLEEDLLLPLLIFVVASSCVWYCLGFLAGSSERSGAAAGKPPKSQPCLAAHPDAGGTSAADCWARGDGRFKHCGLRADPFDPTVGPPILSHNNLDLPLPEMSESERRGLQELMARVEDLRARDLRTDGATMIRFLRARKGNLDAAEAYFRKACEAREKLGVVRMERDMDLATYERIFAPWWTRGGILGVGKQGQIIGFERFGRSYFPELMHALPWDVLCKLDAVHLTRTLAAFEEHAMRSGRWFGGSILVLDLEGLGWEYCTAKVCRTYAKLVEQRDMLLPNTLQRILVIRSPKVFSMIWNAFQHLLDPVVREKVEIVSGHDASLAVLRKHMDNRIIPAHLGGQMKINGDPFCSLLLGSPSKEPPPQEAIKRLLDMAAGRLSEGDAATPTESARSSSSSHLAVGGYFGLGCCFGR